MKAEGAKSPGSAACISSGPSGTRAAGSTTVLRGPAWPPGRPRLVAVLPLARRRPDAEVRRRVGFQHPRPPGDGGRRGDREQDGQPTRRRGAEEDRGAQLRRAEEPARIRRGHGRAAQARLLVPPEAPGRRAGQGRDPRDDRHPDQGGHRPFPGRRLRRRQLRRLGRPAPRASSSPAKPFKGTPTRTPRSRPRREAESQATGQIREAIEESLPLRRAEPSEYNWQAFAAWCNTRYNASIKDKDLPQGRQVRRGRARPHGPSRTSSPRRPLPRSWASSSSPLASSCTEDWGRRTLAGWAYHKFGVAIRPRRLGGDRPARDRQAAPGAGPPALRPQGGGVPRSGSAWYGSWLSRPQGQQSPKPTTAMALPPGQPCASASTSTPRRSAPSSDPRSKPCCSTSPTASTTAASWQPGGSTGGSAEVYRPDGSGAVPTADTSPRPDVPDIDNTISLADWARAEFGADVTAEAPEANPQPRRGPQEAGRRPRLQASARDARDGEGSGPPDPRQ